MSLPRLVQAACRAATGGSLRSAWQAGPHVASGFRRWRPSGDLGGEGCWGQRGWKERPRGLRRQSAVIG